MFGSSGKGCQLARGLGKGKAWGGPTTRGDPTGAPKKFSPGVTGGSGPPVQKFIKGGNQSEKKKKEQKTNPLERMGGPKKGKQISSCPNSIVSAKEKRGMPLKRGPEKNRFRKGDQRFARVRRSAKHSGLVRGGGSISNAMEKKKNAKESK